MDPFSSPFWRCGSKLRGSADSGPTVKRNMMVARACVKESVHHVVDRKWEGTLDTMCNFRGQASNDLLLPVRPRVLKSPKP